jgi:hypothetical protein
MAILDILHDIAPQFTDDAKNNRFILYAEPQVSEDFFGDLYDLAVANLTAHMLTISTRSGSVSGFINNMREGDRSKGYSTPNAKDVDFMTTSYGVEFVRLRNMCVYPILVTGNIYGDTPLV